MAQEHKPLTDKQAMFVKEYLIDLNATKASIRAGYSEANAKVIASQNLAKPNVAAAIQKAMDKRADKIEINSDLVLQNLAKLAGVNLDDITSINAQGLPEFDFSEVTKDQMYCLTEIQTDTIIQGNGDDARSVDKVKIKTVDKLKALEMLGRHLKLFSTDVNLNAEGFTMNLNFGGK